MKDIAALLRAKNSAEQDFSAKEVSATCEPVVRSSGQLLDLAWDTDIAYCGDKVRLLAHAEGMAELTSADAQVMCNGSKVMQMSGHGCKIFELDWNVSDIDLAGPPLSDAKTVDATLSAGGQRRNTERALRVLRPPNCGPTTVLWNNHSGHYAWSGSSQVTLQKNEILVQLGVHFQPAWLGKWVQFEPSADGVSGWFWIKPVANQWLYWNSARHPHRWMNLPRSISNYTVNHVLLVERGGEYVGRDDATLRWPELLAAPEKWEHQVQRWLHAISTTWDRQFDLKRQGCGSDNKHCCRWQLRFAAKWMRDDADQSVFAVVGTQWERATPKDWYLSDPRPQIAARHFGHLLGAYAESAQGANAVDNFVADANSIMGENLGDVRIQHLDTLCDALQDTIEVWLLRPWHFAIEQRLG